MSEGRECPMCGTTMQLKHGESTVQIPGNPMSIKMVEWVGYDNVAKKYVHTAIEDDSTAISRDDGQHDDAKKMIPEVDPAEAIRVPGRESPDAAELVNGVHPFPLSQPKPEETKAPAK